MKKVHLWLILASLMLSLDCRADVVVVMSMKKPACMLNKEQVADIFLGKTLRFSNGEIAIPIDLPDGSSERNEFYARFADRSEAQIRAYWSSLVFTGKGRPPREAADDNEMKRMLVENRNAIGYIKRGNVDDSVRICSERR